MAEIETSQVSTTAIEVSREPFAINDLAAGTEFFVLPPPIAIDVLVIGGILVAQNALRALRK